MLHRTAISQSVKVSLVFIMINKLNTDQALTQVKRLEKMQHIDSAQCSQTDGLSHRQTGCYTLVVWRLGRHRSIDRN